MGAPLNTAYFSNLTAQINAASSCVELQTLATVAVDSLNNLTASITAQGAIVEPVLALLTAPTNPTAVITWVEDFITDYLTPQLVSYTSYVAQLAAIATEATALISALENAAVDIGSCSLTIPTFSPGSIPSPPSPPSFPSFGAAGSISGSATTADPIQLAGDLANPGDNKVYGTNSSGVKGWYAAGGGGYSLDVTDGTTTVSNIDQITFIGGVVSGTSPNATVTITGGGSPGGSSGSLQWNNAGAFDGLPSSWDGTNLTLQGAFESTGTGGGVALLGGGNGSGGQGGSINIESGSGDVSNGSVLISGAGGYTPGPGEVFLLTDTILTLYTNGTLVASIGGQAGTSGQALVSDGAGNVVWGVPAASTFSGVSVGQSSSQSMPANTQTAVACDISNYDTNIYHSTTVNNSRLTAPATGYYLVTANSRPSSSSPPTIYYSLVKNGSGTLMQPSVPANSIVDGGGVSLSWEGRLTAGDYIEFCWYPIGTTVSTDNTNTTFTMSFRGS